MQARAESGELEPTENQQGLAWIEPLQSYLAYLSELDEVISFYLEGLEVIARSYDPPLSGLFADFLATRPPTDPLVQQLERGREHAKAARAQLNTGTPRLLAVMVIAAWSALEAFVFDFLVEWVRDDPELLASVVLDSSQLGTAKIQAAEVATSVGIAQVKTALDKRERRLKDTYPVQIDRFEAMFDAVGLGGALDQSVHRDLLEMVNVRHVLVHRGARVDQKLLDACPWFPHPIGTVLSLSFADWARYRGAVAAYL